MGIRFTDSLLEVVPGEWPQVIQIQGLLVHRRPQLRHLSSERLQLMHEGGLRLVVALPMVD